MILWLILWSRFRAGVPHWPLAALFVTTQSRRQFNNGEPLDAGQ